MALEGERTYWLDQEASKSGLDVSAFHVFDRMSRRAELAELYASSEPNVLERIERKLTPLDLYAERSEEEHFGELRSVLQRASIEPAALLELNTLFVHVARVHPNAYGERWLTYMTSFPHHLRVLSERFNVLPVPGLNFPMRSSYWDPSEELNAELAMWWTALTLYAAHVDALLSHLVSAPPYRYLSELELIEVNEGFERLCAACQFDAVETLTMCRCALNEVSHVEALARSSMLRGVKTLRLRACGLTGASLAHLLAYGALEHVERLELDGNPLGVQGARALAESPLLPSLRDLSISQAGLGDDGLITLAQASHWERLDSLCVSYNDIGDRGAMGLAGAPLGERLRRLELFEQDGRDRLGKRGARALAALPRLESRWREALEDRGYALAALTVMGRLGGAVERRLGSYLNRHRTHKLPANPIEKR